MNRSQLYRQAKALGLDVHWHRPTSRVAYLVEAIEDFLGYADTEVTAPAKRPEGWVEVGIEFLNTDQYGPYIHTNYRVIYDMEPSLRSMAHFVTGVNMAIEEFTSEKRNKSVAIVVRFVSNTGENRFVTVTYDDIELAGGDVGQAIERKIEELIKGEIAGSDALGEEYKLDDEFVRVETGSLLTEGAATFKFAKTVIGTASSKRNANRECFWRSVRISECAKEDKKALEAAKMVDQASKIKGWAKTYGYKVELYADSPLFDVVDGEDIARKEGGKTIIYKKIKVTGLALVGEYNARASQVIKLVTKYDSKQGNYHVELFQGLRDGSFYGNKMGDIFEFMQFEGMPDTRILLQKRSDRVKITAGKEIVKGEKKEKVDATYILTFDFETVFDPKSDGLLRPYSVSWSIRKDDEKKGVVYFYYGWDCVKVLVDWIVANQSRKKFVMLGYNSSRFDNYFLIVELMQRDMLRDCKLVNGSILKMTFSGRHQVFDLCRYLACPLAVACQQFNPLYRKGADLVSHTVIQSMYLKDGEEGLDRLFGLEQGVGYQRDFDGVSKELQGSPLPKLVEYNILDVLSCDCLYMSIDKILREEGIITEPLYKKSTIGGLAWSLLQKNFKEKGIKLPKLSEGAYHRVRGSLFAGRTQAYKGRFSDLSGEQKYDMYDAKSLYPYAYLNNVFPCGEIEDITYEQCVADGKMGFYEVTFSQPDNPDRPNRGAKILPKRSKDKPLDWDYTGEMTMFVNTVDIAQLKKYGAVISKIGGGFAFSEVIEGSKLFAPMNICKNIKEAEDRKPANLPVSEGGRNNVLRNMSKLLINSASGKVIQRVFQKTEKVCRRVVDLEAALQKSNDVKFQKTIGGVSIVSYSESFEHCFKHQNMPIYLGCFIYSHARAHMMDSVLADYDGIYQDTDSFLMPRSEAQRFATEKPHLIGGEFGQFELEDTKGKDIAKVVVIAPKCYFLFSEDETLLKRGFKGINLANDKLLTKSDVQNLISTGGAKFVLRGEPLPTVTLREDTGKAFQDYNETFADRSLSNPKNIMRMCKRLIKNKPVLIMSSSMAKKVSDLCIKQRFTIKNIN